MLGLFSVSLSIHYPHPSAVLFIDHLLIRINSIQSLQRLQKTMGTTLNSVSNEANKDIGRRLSAMKRKKKIQRVSSPNGCLRRLSVMDEEGADAERNPIDRHGRQYGCAASYARAKNDPEDGSCTWF